MHQALNRRLQAPSAGMMREITAEYIVEGPQDWWERYLQRYGFRTQVQDLHSPQQAVLVVAVILSD
jgi:hypothetical protein